MNIFLVASNISQLIIMNTELSDEPRIDTYIGTLIFLIMK